MTNADKGYFTSRMTRTTSELRLPADPAYIVVAKRAASAFAAVAGFDVEAVHDLTIAVAQACENAISCADRAGGLGVGQIRLTFAVEGARLEVQVQSSCTRQALADAAAAQRQQAAKAVEREQQEVAAATDLALRLMGLFVDDHSYRVDERTGGLRVRLTKYRAS
ncbi:MAG: ATP-binding protein [Candidatus Dormibacteraeota bacterium]|uniref:ATP-binding protein n=1 Tax=Candidatus Aeolococcus gillhamiae TaxID=3127015 RepID=A0A934MZS5_9BACT|nr:ATP-binding protein [Candidatus Dormibacteraeota bacterium]